MKQTKIKTATDDANDDDAQDDSRDDDASWGRTSMTPGCGGGKSPMVFALGGQTLRASTAYCARCCETSGEPTTTTTTRTTTKPDPLNPSKRSRYLSWDDYFMSVAFLSAQRSKDPNKQVGACIVGEDKLILGVGYNGFPRGCADNALPWRKKSANDDPLETKYAYVCHAEMNAIMNKNSASVAGGSLYVTMYPCNECAKLIIQAGIKEVVYHEGKISEAKETATTPGDGRVAKRDDPIYAAANRLVKLAGVRVRQHRPSVSIDVTYLNVKEEKAEDSSSYASSSDEEEEEVRSPGIVVARAPEGKQLVFADASA